MIRLARVALVALLAASAAWADASIKEAAEYQDPALLDKAWALPVARLYHDRITYQSHASYCGSTSLVNVARSWGVDPRRVPREAQGIALDRMAELATRLGKKATVLRDLDLNHFRKELRRSNDPRARYIVNFARGPLFAEGGGHHSPIAGYLADEDLVLVLDVNESYHPWLVRTQRLLDAMNTMDRGAKAERGLLRLEEQALWHRGHLSCEKSTMRILMSLSLISAMSTLSACGGGKKAAAGNDASMAPSSDAAIASMDAGADASVVGCAPGTGCTAVDKTCIGLVDNTGTTKFGLRMSQLTLTKPTSLTSGLIGSTLASAVTPDVQSCNLDGMGTFSWLLQFDTTAGTLLTGGARPVSDPASGYSFDSETIAGIAIAPATMTTTVGATGAFAVTTGVALDLPIFLTADGTSSLILPIQQARVATGTLSSSHNCIGSYNAAGLQPSNSCQPDSTTPAFVTGGTVDGFIALADADQVIIAPLSESLCVLLSGDAATYGDGASPSHCKTDTSGQIVFQGDWCSTTNAAATSSCADAVQLKGDFAASSIKID